MRIFILLTLVFSLGCSTSPKTQKACAVTDWFEKGRLDGASGQKPSPQIADCNPDDSQVAEYQTGYNRGLIEFCSPENAMALGKAGIKHHEVCPSPMSSKFKEHYGIGLEIFKLKREQEIVQSQIDNLFRLLTMKSLSDLEKNSLREQLTSLESMQSSIDRKLNQLQSTN